ncbi:hypothetical protein FISHEDRAFT_58247 [Fistulina hepatica ATCC 64428]|nr:hypothetical protein FISHEDRAFT_58247 [Fistulina hepatica ATCC 64428]
MSAADEDKLVPWEWVAAMDQRRCGMESLLALPTRLPRHVARGRLMCFRDGITSVGERTLALHGKELVRDVEQITRGTETTAIVDQKSVCIISSMWRQRRVGNATLPATAGVRCKTLERSGWDPVRAIHDIDAIGLQRSLVRAHEEFLRMLVQ